MPVQEVCGHKLWEEEIWGRQKEASRTRQEKAHKCVDWLHTVTQAHKMAQEETHSFCTQTNGILREKKRHPLSPLYSTIQLFNAPVKHDLKSKVIPHFKRGDDTVFGPKFRLLFGWSSSPVYVSFLQVLYFPPTSQKHECRWIGFDKLPWGVNMCTWCPTMDWSTIKDIRIPASHPVLCSGFMVIEDELIL